MLTPGWIVTTLLVIAAAASMVRLGFWQLDRLAERRAFNAGVAAQASAPELDLNAALPAADLTGMEYRRVVVTGVYDPENEIVLRNQVYNNLPGDHLLTPLRIAGSETAVLVDRGFIPLEERDPALRAKYARAGVVTLRGVLRLPHVPRFAGAPDPTLAPGQTRLDAWNAINLERIQQQAPYPLLPVYIQAAPIEPAGSTEPVAQVEAPDLSEGSHLSYAGQWFSFAALLAGGYPFFVKKRLKQQA